MIDGTPWYSIWVIADNFLKSSAKIALVIAVLNAFTFIIYREFAQENRQF
jgi:hypothetical protein